MKENDDNLFLHNAAEVLSETIMVHPSFTEREAALREFKGKLSQEEYSPVIARAVENLIYIIKNNKIFMFFYLLFLISKIFKLLILPIASTSVAFKSHLFNFRYVSDLFFWSA